MPKELNFETLAEFIENLPTAAKIEKEAGLQQGYLSKILSKTRPLTEETKAKLLPVLKRYNF